MRPSLLLFLFWLLTGSAWAQAPTFQWSVAAGGTLADEARGLVADAQGNSYVAGIFRGTASFGTGTAAVQLVATPSGGTASTSDVFLAKYNAGGGLVWAQRHGGSGNDEALGLATDPQGNLLVVGTFTGTATFGAGAGAVALASAGADDVFLSKFDPNGALLWARRLGSASTSAENGYAVATDSLGHVVITGDYRDGATIDGSTTTLAGGGGSDVFIVKFDAAGALLWARRGTSAGTTDAGRAVAIDRAGNVLVTGSFRETMTFDGGSSPALRLRSRASADLFVVKYDRNGAALWARLGTGGASEIGRALATDRRGNAYLLTSYRDSAYFLGAANDSVRVRNPAGNGDDIALVQYSRAGAVQWIRSDGGAGSDESIALATDEQNNVYAVSYFQLTARYGPAGTGVTFTSAGTSDVAVASYTSGGAFRWAQRLGGPSNDIGYAAAVDGTGQLAVAGYFTAGPFTAGAGQFPLFSQPSTTRDIFVAKTTRVTTAARPGAAATRPVGLYPNPATGSVRVSPAGAAASLLLLDGVGRLVRTASVPATGFTLSTAGLPAGRYTVLLRWADGQQQAAPLLVLP
ncbi:hypothetical protein GCM10027048_21920 [Hymenobacter coalescens]